MRLPPASSLPAPGFSAAGMSLPPASALPAPELLGMGLNPPHKEPSRESKMMKKMADAADEGGTGRHSIVSAKQNRAARLWI